MRSRIGARIVAAIAAAVLGVGMILLPSAAHAAAGTSIRFTTVGPVEVAFGEDWLLVLKVEYVSEDGPTFALGPADGTVDVYFSGIGGAYATGLAIQPDGNVYVSQPTAQPLLPAGSYDVSAIFNPSSGSYYESGQTATPLPMTVTALDVAPAVEVVNDPAVSELPIITARLSGSYVDAAGGAPAGTWHFLVAGADGTAVFETDVAQAQGESDPIRVEIDSPLEEGHQYAVKSTFTPVDELAGGVTVAPIADSTFQTPSGTFGEAITAPVPIPLWLAIVLLALVLGLATAAIVIGVKLAGRGAVPSAETAPAPQRMPGDPLNVEVVSLEDIGLPDPETIPELLPEGETKKLPASTTWLLSDVEPATSLPDASEAPTERIDAISSAKLDAEPADAPTEKLSTSETDLPTEKLATGEIKPEKDS
jgi:hypothetical protein